MIRKGLQIFAAGWFTAACFVSIYYFFYPDSLAKPVKPNQRPPDIQELEEEKIISFLEEKGFTVLNSEEVQELKQNAASDDKNNENKEASAAAVNAVLHIEKGMSSRDVASLLHQLNMIEDISSFEKEMNKSGAATSIQAGFYQLNSDMAEEEMINDITK
ncbi:hypothetical protein ACE1TI_13200 [Alteribacillus sp. JSM 102045]|uniref:hypothetical protein n=1 Tax=Alteribacillus sp. JSM 102045 TaxID=1562101 RepID=UPI0035BFE122